MLLFSKLSRNHTAYKVVLTPFPQKCYSLYKQSLIKVTFGDVVLHALSRHGG